MRSLFLVLLIITVIIFSAERVANSLPERGDPFSPPSAQHILGTDDVGKDVLRNILLTSKNSILISLSSAAISTAIGLMLGLLAGYYERTKLLDLFIDVVLVIPTLPLLIVIAFHSPPSMWIVSLTIALLNWPTMARVARARVKQLKESGFVICLLAIGATHSRIILRHLIPNMKEIIYTRFSMLVAYSLIAESSLSFLGLGEPDKSLGGLLHYAVKRGAILSGAWWCFTPGFLIMVISSLFMAISLKEFSDNQYG